MGQLLAPYCGTSLERRNHLAERGATLKPTHYWLLARLAKESGEVINVAASVV